MTGAKSNNDIFSIRRSVGAGDIEAGSSSGHLCIIETKVMPFEASLEKMIDGGSDHEHVDDLDKWTCSLAKILEDVPQYMCCPGHPGRISRIPEHLREAAVKAYEPYFLSLGPYYHGKPTLKSGDISKGVILKCFLKQKPEVTLKDYLMEIKHIESAARSFYSGVDMDSEKFVRMLLLDCMFILSQFCGMPRRQVRLNKIDTETMDRVVTDDMNERAQKIMEGNVDEDDTENIQTITVNNEASSAENGSVPPAWFWGLFVHDIFLLENQLPFFVLQKMHDLAYGNSGTQLIDLMKYHIGTMLSTYTRIESGILIPPTEEVHHLLHLCHMFFRPTLQEKSVTLQLAESDQIFRLGSAVQLYEAGVKFEARSNSTQHSLLDITFGNSGQMIMPCFYVDDNIDSLLRNLIALEQMKYPNLGLDISAYAVLLLHLVTTPEDVKLLRRKGIIVHHLSSDKEMMYLINRLSVGLAFDYVEDRYGLKPVFQELKRYTERRVPRWRAWLKQRYFGNPWTVISLMAASLLLLLTAVQTFYVIYPYYQ